MYKKALKSGLKFASKFGKKAYEGGKSLAKKGIEKGIEKSKQAVKEGKRKIALEVIDATKDKVATNQKIHLKASEELVRNKYAKGGGVGLGTNYNVVYEKPNSDIAWKETINANSIKEAKEKFKSKHPNCNILNISEEYANGGGIGSSNSWNYTIGGL